MLRVTKRGCLEAVFQNRPLARIMRLSASPTCLHQPFQLRCLVLHEANTDIRSFGFCRTTQGLLSVEKQKAKCSFPLGMS
jgi:hypothetical protein